MSEYTAQECRDIAAAAGRRLAEALEADAIPGRNSVHCAMDITRAEASQRQFLEMAERLEAAAVSAAG